jgi:hypothetical protein
MTEWIELIRTAPASLITIKPLEEMKKVVKMEENSDQVEDVVMEEKLAMESPSKPKLPPVIGELYAKKGISAIPPLSKPASAGGIPKEPSHDPTRLRVARYLEQEHGLSRAASLTLEAALFDQAADPGLAYKAALKRIVDQPKILSSNLEALDSGSVRPALLLALRG